MSNLIVITGITGTQRGSIANTYLHLPGWKVRGLTRTPTSPKAQSWASKGVEIVYADLNDLSSLKIAFQGATVIFGVTGFWTSFQDPKSLELKRSEQDITEYSYEVEVQQGKNIADAAVTVPILQRCIFSSRASATKWSGGKFHRIYHMDSKAVVVDYIEGLEGLNGKFSQIQAPIYFNLLWQWGLPTTPRKQEDGIYRIHGVGSSNIPIPFGDVQSDFGRCFQAVAEASAGINFLALGEMLSWDKYLEIRAQSQKVPAGGYEEHTIALFEELLPGGLGRDFGENVLFAQQFGYEGGSGDVVRPEQFGIQMTPFEEYCAKTDFSAIL
ncbi:putative NAD dependent epimerase/dehydratase [Aspergillus crustosus]